MLGGAQLYHVRQALMGEFDIFDGVSGGLGLMTNVKLPATPGKYSIDASTMKRIQIASYEFGALEHVGGNRIMMSPLLVIPEAEIDQILAGWKWICVRPQRRRCFQYRKSSGIPVDFPRNGVLKSGVRCAKESSAREMS